jgi:hypothetical protein
MERLQLFSMRQHKPPSKFFERHPNLSFRGATASHIRRMTP